MLNYKIWSKDEFVIYYYGYENIEKNTYKDGQEIYTAHRIVVFNANIMCYSGIITDKDEIESVVEHIINTVQELQFDKEGILNSIKDFMNNIDM